MILNKILLLCLMSLAYASIIAMDDGNLSSSDLQQIVKSLITKDNAPALIDKLSSKIQNALCSTILKDYRSELAAYINHVEIGVDPSVKIISRCFSKECNSFILVVTAHNQLEVQIVNLEYFPDYTITKIPLGVKSAMFALDSNGKYIAVGLQNGVRLYPIENGTIGESSMIISNICPQYCMTTKDGSFLIIMANNKKDIYIYDVKNRIIKKFKNPSGEYQTSFCASQNSDYIASIELGLIPILCVYKLAGDEKENIVIYKQVPIDCYRCVEIDFIENNKILLLCAPLYHSKPKAIGTVITVEPEGDVNQNTIENIPGMVQPLEKVSINHTGGIVFLDKEGYISYGNTHDILNSFIKITKKFPTPSMISICMSDNKQFILTREDYSHINVVKLFDISDDSSIVDYDIQFFESSITHAQFSSNNRFIMLGGTEKSIILDIAALTGKDLDLKMLIAMIKKSKPSPNQSLWDTLSSFASSRCSDEAF